MKQSENIKISIITTTYNSERFFEETIQSVIQQNYPNIEYIVIDGGSTDGTINLIKKYEKHISYWVSEPDKGIYDAINKGIKKATGHLVKIINSDDRLTKNSVKTAVSFYLKELQNHRPEDFILISPLERMTEQGVVRAVWGTKDYVIFFENLLHPTWYVPKEVYEKIGLYDLSYKIASDYDYFMKLLSNKIKIVKSETAFAQYREGGASSNFSGRKEVIAIKKKYKGNLKAFLLKLQIEMISAYTIIRQKLRV